MAHKQMTIQDVADAAGVSKTTISRYLNGKFDFMSEKTKQHIADIISQTGYRPSRVANSLKTKKSGLIGFVMSNIMESQTPRLLGSICDTCAKYGKKIIIVNSEKDPEKERMLVYELLDQRVDGLLVASGYNADFYRQLDQEELPVVLVDRIQNDIEIESVAINHVDSSRRVIEHMIAQGFERIFILKRKHRNPNNTPDIRVRTVIEVCKEHFQDESHCKTIILNSGYPEDDSFQKLQEITDILSRIYEESKEIPTAVFVAEAVIMSDVAVSYYRNRLTISKNFTIAGYSERNMGGMMVTPPISTIEQPLERMGELATERLINRIDNKGSISNTTKERELLNCSITLAKAPEK